MFMSWIPICFMFLLRIFRTIFSCSVMNFTMWTHQMMMMTTSTSPSLTCLTCLCLSCWPMHRLIWYQVLFWWQKQFKINRCFDLSRFCLTVAAISLYLEHFLRGGLFLKNSHCNSYVVSRQVLVLRRESQKEYKTERPFSEKGTFQRKLVEVSRHEEDTDLLKVSTRIHV